jgi:hypothetical protein
MVFMEPNSLLQPSGEPSGIDDLVVRPDTRLSDRRKTRTPSNDRWHPN